MELIGLEFKSQHPNQTKPSQVKPSQTKNSNNQKTSNKKTCNVTCVFNASTQEADTGRFKFKTNLVHKSSSRARQWDPVSNKHSKQRPGKVALVANGSSKDTEDDYKLT